MVPKDSQYEAGMATRKKVVGEDHVAQNLAQATEFSSELQDHVTRNAWGTVWQRGGIDLKTRSLVTVGMLIALGRGHEVGGHCRGAINNGATEDELREVLIHATVYCGFPLALDAYKAADAEITRLKSKAK